MDRYEEQEERIGEKVYDNRTNFTKHMKDKEELEEDIDSLHKRMDYDLYK